jgi:hypothetical protein
MNWNRLPVADDLPIFHAHAHAENEPATTLTTCVNVHIRKCLNGYASDLDKQGTWNNVPRHKRTLVLLNSLQPDACGREFASHP